MDDTLGDGRYTWGPIVHLGTDGAFGDGWCTWGRTVHLGTDGAGSVWALLPLVHHQLPSVNRGVCKC